MRFAAIHIPNFILQAAVRAALELRSRPVCVAEGTPPLEQIVAANRAALAQGIRVGMTRAQAEEFEGLAILKRSAALEKAAHGALRDLGWAFSPRLEDTAVDTILLDLAGLAGLFGSEEKIARRLAEGAAAMDFSAQVAIADNLDAAFHASRGFSGITLIPPGDPARCLGSLPLETLAISPEMMETLESWGVRTCAALAALPVLQLSERLGQEGVRLHTLARGASSRSMVVAEPEACFEEAMELDCPVEELEPLAFILARLLEQLCVRLGARSLAASAIHLRFELEASFQDDRQAERRTSPAHEGKKEREILRSAQNDNLKTGVYEKTLALPVPMRDSKMLLSLVRLYLQSHPPSGAILKIALSATAAARRGAQGGLFLPSRPQPEKLELTIARLANLVGEAHVGAPELVDSHRPGKFRMGHFCLHSEKDEKRDDESAEEHARSGAGAPTTAFRFFRPPVPARVEIRNGCPARIGFQAPNGGPQSWIDGGIVAASGPWRTSGEWWEADGWRCDEWDVEVCLPSLPAAPAEAFISNDQQSAGASRPSRGIYRIFFDGIRRGWYVRGEYD